MGLDESSYDVADFMCCDDDLFEVFVSAFGGDRLVDRNGGDVCGRDFEPVGHPWDVPHSIADQAADHLGVVAEFGAGSPVLGRDQHQSHQDRSWSAVPGQVLIDQVMCTREADF